MEVTYGNQLEHLNCSYFIEYNMGKGVLKRLDNNEQSFLGLFLEEKERDI